jgi:hypothetical protein
VRWCPWQDLNFDFTGVVFDGGDFTRVVFSGGEVSFSHAHFSGGTVDFTSPFAWSSLPDFGWTGTPPPGVKLPKEEDQSQA